MSNVVEMGMTSPRAERLSNSVMDTIETELNNADMPLIEVVGILEAIKSHYLIKSWLETNIEDE